MRYSFEEKGVSTLSGMNHEEYTEILPVLLLTLRRSGGISSTSIVLPPDLPPETIFSVPQGNADELYRIINELLMNRNRGAHQ